MNHRETIEQIKESEKIFYESILKYKIESAFLCLFVISYVISLSKCICKIIRNVKRK